MKRSATTKLYKLRVVWGFRPVVRVKNSKKIYSRKKEWKSDVHTSKRMDPSPAKLGG